VVSGSTFNAGTYDLSETGGPTGYSASAWSCVKNDGAPVEDSSIALAVGDSATCTITNDDNAPTLKLRKTVTNDNAGTAVATDWTLRANKSGTDTTTYELSGTTPVDSGATFSIGSYDLSETGGPDGYSASAWSCVKNGGAPVSGSSVTLGLGDTATCTITNDDDINLPEIASSMSWILHDSMALTGFLSGGGTSSATFNLYKDDGTMTSCESATLIHTETVLVDDNDGTASTSTGELVTEAGTYRWVVTFSGNTYNASLSTDCGDEVTILP
jgi:hypothetical protein